MNTKSVSKIYDQTCEEMVIIIPKLLQEISSNFHDLFLRMNRIASPTSFTIVVLTLLLVLIASRLVVQHMK